MHGNLSSTKPIKIEELDFSARFAEACGSAEPARIQRSLNISYQAAKNYLAGRLPDTKILLLIAEKTPYSIHWLLTGEGEKLARCASQSADTRLTIDLVRTMIREECRHVVKELFDRNEDGSRTIVLDRQNIRSEKVNEHDDNIAVNDLLRR